MEGAIDDWLMAREQWLGGCDPEKLERFTTATEVLYVAFAHDWMGDDHSLATAFHRPTNAGAPFIAVSSR